MYGIVVKYVLIKCRLWSRRYLLWWEWHV